MCIAIYVPAGKTITEKQIRNAFSNNKDGAGVMHYDKAGQVHYAKGFMDVESLLKYWNNSTSDKYPRALHCRIATSGKISKGCCHPFPIGNNLDSMLVTKGIGKDGCLIHNGVFSKYTPKEGLESPYSDTMIFTQKVIYPLVRMLNNSGVQELLSELTSRVLVFLPNFEVHRYGKWEYEDEHGFYASNSTYEYNKSDWDWIGNQYLNGCNTTYISTPYTNNYLSKLKSETEEPRLVHVYGISVAAANEQEATEKLEDFIGTYEKSLANWGWDSYDTLEEYNEGEWTFYAYAKIPLDTALEGTEYKVFEQAIEDDWTDEFGLDGKE